MAVWCWLFLLLRHSENNLREDMWIPTLMICYTNTGLLIHLTLSHRINACAYTLFHTITELMPVYTLSIYSFDTALLVQYT